MGALNFLMSHQRTSRGESGHGQGEESYGAVCGRREELAVCLAGDPDGLREENTEIWPSCWILHLIDGLYVGDVKRDLPLGLATRPSVPPAHLRMLGKDLY